MAPPTTLAGQVAVVTGAASGLGRAIALLLAHNGVRVAVWDLEAEGARRAAADIGPLASSQIADVTDTASIRAAWAGTRVALGTPSILVNSAGILGPRAAFADYPEDERRLMHRVIVAGTAPY